MARGLLTSQIGHDAGSLVRAVYRGDHADDLSVDARLRVLDNTGREIAAATCRPWGRCWNAQWWTADFGILPEGTWNVFMEDRGREIETATITVAPQLLWRSTWNAVALQQLERRAKISSVGNGAGWQDAGCDWQEINSHAACVVGLCDLLQMSGGKMSEAERERVRTQIRVGCRFFERMQDEAVRDGLPKGSLIHEPRRARRALTRDGAWAALAWAKSAQVMPAEAPAWRERAQAALLWWEAAPHDNAAMDAVAHGWRPGYRAPDTAPTVDTALAAWAWAELAADADDEAGRRARKMGADILALQIAPGALGPDARETAAPHGHFWEFPDRAHAAPVWTHNMIGPDTGETGMSPAWPLVRLAQRFADHGEAKAWHAGLQAYAEGWLLPQKDASPFAAAARAWNGGWVHFGGLWHGMNAVYGHQAALCDDLAGLLGMPELRDLAHANRQWIAGLNAGLTTEAVIAACHMTVPATQPGRAHAAAMIQGIGQRWVGGWMAIPGSIPNGFCVGDQFRTDVPAEPACDGPPTFTDEDWIVHAGGWLMAVARSWPDGRAGT